MNVYKVLIAIVLSILFVIFKDEGNEELEYESLSNKEICDIIEESNKEQNKEINELEEQIKQLQIENVQIHQQLEEMQYYKEELQ
jgi:hypothetical protein